MKQSDLLNTVKLHYNGLLGTTVKGSLCPKSVISKLGYRQTVTKTGNWNVCSASSEDPYQLRGNNRRIYKVRSRGEIRRNFFSQRVVDHWNKLPQEIIAADSVNIFKSRLDKFWRQTADMGQWTISHRFSPIIIKFKFSHDCLRTLISMTRNATF